MEKLANVILDLCKDTQVYVYVVAIVGLIISGILMMIPSAKVHEKVSPFIPWIVLGFIIAAGAVSLGTWLKNKVSF